MCYSVLHIRLYFAELSGRSGKPTFSRAATLGDGAHSGRCSPELARARSMATFDDAPTVPFCTDYRAAKVHFAMSKPPALELGSCRKNRAKESCHERCAKDGSPLHQ